MHRRTWLIVVAACFALGGPAAGAGEPSAQALDDAITDLWRALGNAPGRAPEAATLRRLFHPDARVLGVDSRKGVASLREQSRREFIAGYERERDRGSYARETKREVTQYAAMAHVLSLIESREVRDAPEADHASLYSMQWYWNGSQWQLVSLYYHRDDPKLPLPRGAP